MKKIRTNIHLEANQLKKISQLAKKEKVTRAEMVRRAINKMIETMNNEGMEK